MSTDMFGTITEIISTNSSFHAIYEPISGHIVIIGEQNSNNSTGWLCSISGNELSVVTSTSFDTQDPFDLSVVGIGGGKFVVIYNRNYSAMYAVVGSVSGDTLSFGTPTLFSSGSSIGLDVVYDSTNGKVVPIWCDYTAGKILKGIVGTVSGNSISFGSVVDLSEDAGAYDLVDCQALYMPSLGKIVVTYRHGNFSSTAIAARAKVVTVSGTTLTFGSPTTFISDEVYMPNKHSTLCLVNGTSTKFLVPVCYYGSGGYAYVFVGTVSGDSVSFGSPTVIGDKYYSNFDIIYNSVTGYYYITTSELDLTFTIGNVVGDAFVITSTVDHPTISSLSTQMIYDSANDKIVTFFMDDSDYYTYGFVVITEPPLFWHNFKGQHEIIE